MTSSLLEGQLWIWGLTPTSLHSPPPQESLRPTFGKASSLFLLRTRNEFDSWVGMGQRPKGSPSGRM